MENKPKTNWDYTNGQVSIDPYRQKIIHQSGNDRHSDAMESEVLLSKFTIESNLISDFIRTNIELKKFVDEINHSVKYYSSESYFKDNKTIFNIEQQDLIDFSQTLKTLQRKKKQALILYSLFIITLNGGIYLATFLNERIVYLFIVSALVTIILLYTMISNFLEQPKFGKGVIVSFKRNESTVLAGKNIHSTSLFIEIGQHHLYNFRNYQIDSENYSTIFENTNYQLNKEMLEKISKYDSYVNFITSSKNEIYLIINSYR